MRILATSSIFKSQEAELHCAGSCWHELLEPSRPSKAQKRSYNISVGKLAQVIEEGIFPALFWPTIFSCPLHLLPGHSVTLASLAYLHPQSWWLRSEFVVLPFSCQPLQFLSPSIAACSHWANSRVLSSTHWQIYLCCWVRMTCSWTKLPFWYLFFLLFLLLPSKAALFLMYCLLGSWVRIGKLSALIQDLFS